MKDLPGTVRTERRRRQSIAFDARASATRPPRPTLHVPGSRSAGPVLSSLLLLASLVGFPAASRAVHLPPLAEKGEVVFKEKCAACHTVGGGRAVGPDLSGVTGRRDRRWIMRMITEPGALFDAGDPTATTLLKEYRGVRMPAIQLPADALDALLAYLDAEGGAVGGKASGEAATGAAKAPPAGDPATGERLFSGTLTYANGAPSCLACHAIAGTSGFGGGTLGPDLTRTYADYGEDGIVPVLADFPFPTMKPVYDGRPLTIEEQAHVKAYMRAASEGGSLPSRTTGCILLYALGGAAVVFALPHLVFRRRLRVVRRELLDAAARPKGSAR